MTIEVLLLAIACGITMVAYLVAINAHGAFRISFSYFVATLMLAGTVWLVVQYVNEDLEVKRNYEMLRQEAKRKADEEAYRKDAESMVLQNKVLANYTTKLVILIANASAVANQLISVDLQNKNADYETLVARAAEAKGKVETLYMQYSKMDSIQEYLPDQCLLVKDGFKSLNDAVVNYRSYYLSEDSTQESQREKVLKIKAKDALDKFNKASALLNK